jgi:hypothetical protein
MFLSPSTTPNCFRCGHDDLSPSFLSLCRFHLPDFCAASLSFPKGSGYAEPDFAFIVKPVSLTCGSPDHEHLGIFTCMSLSVYVTVERNGLTLTPRVCIPFVLSYRHFYVLWIPFVLYYRHFYVLW